MPFDYSSFAAGSDLGNYSGGSGMDYNSFSSGSDLSNYYSGDASSAGVGSVGSIDGSWNGTDFSGGGGGSGGGSGWTSQDTGNAIGIAGGLYNMFSHSPNSIRGAQENAARMAMPFDPRSYGGWIPWASQQLQDTPASSGYSPDFGNINADRSAIQSINTNLSPINPQIGVQANTHVSNAGLTGATGKASMNPVLQALQTNDPSMQFRYGMGLDSLSRGAAATGTLASGKQLTELEQYGQGFASQEFSNMFARQTQLQALSNATQQQNYSEQLGTFGANLQSNMQDFNKLVTSQGLTTGREEAMFNQNLQKQSLVSNVDEAKMQQQEAAAQINQRAAEDEFNKRVLQMNESMTLAGVNMDQPGVAAGIMNSPYGGAVQQAQTNLGSAQQRASGGNSTMSGAMQGAEVGAAFGPWGALAGGIIGAFAGS